MQVETADFDVADFTQPRKGDERLAVRFFKKAKQHAAKSEEAGRPIFEEVEYIHVMVPGDRNHIITRPVTVMDKARFSQQYEHWKRTASNDGITGTPLEAWGVLSLAQVEEFRYFGIRTVEDMAQLRDDVCQKMPGAVTLKQRAEAFLAAAKEAEPVRKVQAELAKRDQDIDALRKALDDQARIIEELRTGAASKAVDPKKK